MRISKKSEMDYSISLSNHSYRSVSYWRDILIEQVFSFQCDDEIDVERRRLA